MTEKLKTECDVELKFFQTKQWSSEAGFTLFEVLAAFVLLSLFLSWFIPGLAQIRQAELRMQQRVNAYLLGYGKLQEVIYQAELGVEGKFAEPWSNYAWQWEEEEKGTLKVQTLTVKWKDLNHERQLRLSHTRLQAD